MFLSYFFFFSEIFYTEALLTWWKIPDFFRSAWSKNQSCFKKFRELKCWLFCPLKPLIDKINKLLSVGYYCLSKSHILMISFPLQLPTHTHTHNKNLIVDPLLLFFIQGSTQIMCNISTSNALSPFHQDTGFSWMCLFLPTATSLPGSRL